MNYVFVDEETGECFERSTFRDNYLSSSTLNFTDPKNNNLETGEPEEANENPNLARRRVPFQIPRALQGPGNEECDQERKRLENRNDRSTSKMKKIRRSETFGQINPTMLCLPIVFYFRWVIAILMIVEVFLHVWSHHKNKYLKNSNVYFRSPLHSFTAEFCAVCQSETCMDRVGKMQAIRADKFLRQCNYMKRVVT